MINPITLLGAALCIGALVLKYRSQPAGAPKSSPKKIRATAKILLGAILAWMSVGFALRHLSASIDGQHEEESTVERVVHFVEKLL
jgi:hypothetical protein